MRLSRAMVVLLCAGCTQRTSAPPPAAAPTAAPATPDTTQALNNRDAAAVLRRISGRETEPAEQVFSNVQWLKGEPARTFLAIMNVGYARALGVRCTHCHVAGDYASDEKRPKRAAREMAAMHRMINQELQKMENLASPANARSINCTTCHRGKVNPRGP
jgi:Photosynthetic reaction centre cytochrome C subunit